MKIDSYQILNYPFYRGPRFRWVYAYDVDKDDPFKEVKWIVGVAFETKTKGWCLFFRYNDWEDWISG